VADRFVLTPMRAFLKPRKEFFVIDDTRQYKRVTVRLHAGGIVLRDEVYGSQLRTKKQQATKTGDLLVAEIDAKVGGIGIVPPELAGAIVSSHYFLYEIDETFCHPKYLEYYIRSGAVEEQFQEFVRGSTNYASIRAHHTLELQIPLPPLDEQRRIVARVEELAALIEEARELRVKAREEAEALLASALRGVFFGLTQNPDCEKTQLGRVAELQRGRFSHRPRNDPRFFGGDHPWIQIGEIESARKYITDYKETLNDEGLAISRKFLKGTLLISIAATIGAIGILSFDCCVPDSIVAVIPDETKVTSEFLYYFLAHTRSHLEEIAPQSAQKNINLRILQPLPISLPPLDGQHRIVAYLDSLQAQVDRLTATQDATQAELDALLPSVLDQAFRGEL
jgi:type I restriction enzyme S subunit